MRLTLCLPGLLLPHQALIDTVSDLELPALSHLLGRGRLHRDMPAAHYDRMMQRWDLDALPAAALRLLGEGGNPGDAEWLCLDPVHFSVHRRGVKLDDPTALDLSADEDAALRAALAPFLADLGELTATAPGHWYLRLRTSCELVTTALPDAAGKPVDPVLPGGHDGMPWRQRLAEAQVLLHGHAVNRAREAAGRPTIDSLWPWGQGRLARPLARPFDTLWSTDPVAQGLGRASGIAVGATPQRFEDAAGSVLAIVGDLAAPARSLDALAWREALERLEAHWFAPTVAALRSGRCTGLHLAAFGPDASLDLDVGRSDLLKIWRRPLALARLAA